MRKWRVRAEAGRRGLAQGRGLYISGSEAEWRESDLGLGRLCSSCRFSQSVL